MLRVVRALLSVFQFLLGRLETLPPPIDVDQYAPFQFLLGRLETAKGS